MFCAPELVFDGTEGVRSCFLVLRARTRFQRDRGRRDLFSCFALPDSFSAVSRASGPVFMFCAPGLIFGGTVGVGSCFHVLRSQSLFRPYRGRCLILMFCAPGLVFGGTEGVGSYFQVLRARTHFRRYRGRRVSFTCFSLPDSFSALSMASGPVFMFCATRLVFGGTMGIRFLFHVLRARTRFWRYRWRSIPFSCFASPNSFSAVPGAWGPVFMFCAPGLVFGGTEGVGTHFHVLHSRTRFPQYRGRRVPFSYFALPDSFSAVPMASSPVFIFCATGLFFGGTDGFRSRFHILRARTRCRRYGGRRDPFSCLARPDSFSTVPRASGCFFMFYAPELIFGGTEVVRSCFLVLRARTRIRRYRGRRFLFSCFARPDSLTAVPRALDPVFKLCAPFLVFSCTEGVGTRFHVLRARTHIWRYRGRRISFSSFALPDSFLTVRRASGPVFMFCAPGLVFGRT
jgi:hypothetical protein